MAAHAFRPKVPRRAAALACVIGAHLLVLLLLFSPGVPPMAPTQNGEPALLWTFLPPGPREGVGSSAPQRPGSSLGARRLTHPRIPPPTSQMLHGPATASGRIDWGQQALSTAISEVAREESGRRRAGALAQPKSALFSNHPPGRRFAWSHAATHRVESLQNGGLAINLSDECTLIFAGLMLIPVCVLEKAPPRADLFDRMHGVGYEDERDDSSAQESLASH